MIITTYNENEIFLFIFFGDLYVKTVYQTNGYI